MHIHIHVTCTCTGQDWTAEGWHKADLFTIHCMLGNKFTLTVLYPGFQKWGLLDVQNHDLCVQIDALAQILCVQNHDLCVQDAMTRSGYNAVILYYIYGLILVRSSKILASSCWILASSNKIWAYRDTQIPELSATRDTFITPLYKNIEAR